jgi:hypothetical protein
MAKSTKFLMVRRGTEYTIERKPDGTFGRFIPVGKSSLKTTAQKSTSKTASANTVISNKISCSFNWEFTYEQWMAHYYLY